MHVSIKRVLGMAVPVLLGGALAAGMAASPASAATWQDTALVAGAVSPGTFGGTNLATANGTAVVDLSGSGVTWALHGTVAGVSLSGTVISYSGAAVSGTTNVVVDATDSAGNAVAIVIPVTLAANSIQINGKVTVVTVSGLTDSNVAGTVKFAAASSASANTLSFAETNLPAGLTSGSPALTYVGGTAAPGTYGGVKVTATDSMGAAQTGLFTLVVYGTSVGNYGDEVNRFGNGFDVYQQHQVPGAIIAGWTATQADPATHFILNAGTHPGAYQFEYAPHGSAVGLCVSDPGGGWASDPLRDGLILTTCNTGPWQQFIPQSDGTLKNLATGLFVNPNGTGAQLRGGSAATSWGGSAYTWTAFGNLPA